jgi:DNA-binding SARP family transcriptional activator
VTSREGLQIYLLGDLKIVRHGQILALPPSKKTRALLAYLVATGRPHLRERLCYLLWEGPDDPRVALRRSLTKLSPLLNADGTARLDWAGRDLGVDGCRDAACAAEVRIKAAELHRRLGEPCNVMGVVRMRCIVRCPGSADRPWAGRCNPPPP